MPLIVELDFRPFERIFPPRGRKETAAGLTWDTTGRSVLGAGHFMALFGGAMASQLRPGNPLFRHILFSIYLGLAMWGGLWLRNPRLRAPLPLAGT
jgi:hypothetical protein